MPTFKLRLGGTQPMCCREACNRAKHFTVRRHLQHLVAVEHCSSCSNDFWVKLLQPNDQQSCPSHCGCNTLSPSDPSSSETTRSKGPNWLAAAPGATFRGPSIVTRLLPEKRARHASIAIGFASSATTSTAVLASRLQPVQLAVA